MKSSTNSVFTSSGKITTESINLAHKYENFTQRYAFNKKKCEVSRNLLNRSFELAMKKGQGAQTPNPKRSLFDSLRAEQEIDGSDESPKYVSQHALTPNRPPYSRRNQLTPGKSPENSPQSQQQQTNNNPTSDNNPNENQPNQPPEKIEDSQQIQTSNSEEEEEIIFPPENSPKNLSTNDESDNSEKYEKPKSEFLANLKKLAIGASTAGNQIENELHLQRQSTHDELAELLNANEHFSSDPSDEAINSSDFDAQFQRKFGRSLKKSSQDNSDDPTKLMFKNLSVDLIPTEGIKPLIKIASSGNLIEDESAEI
ncbi:hypothetical protein TRFO_37866 [Tritrichomonas foetus]|uniref:Uncharacterized protein n=1 Tax=Tritrichomonas foetus TaxID=1144522 RepID=A0A1J4JFG9_9EUKA|nr:hypothetical protein TRFO_37866 [Tritrichomonas foetus]|eukprot:OHS95972.1 hypothetical protein TRFO_37866 [Tritrichomonas foetus]